MVRILVVDDEPLVAKALARILRGHDIAICTSGASGLAALTSDTTFDLVFCDLMMPDLSGMQVYERLRDAGNAHLERIVFMTGGAFVERLREFLQVVPNQHIEKPFDLDNLRQVVADFERRAAEGG